MTDSHAHANRHSDMQTDTDRDRLDLIINIELAPIQVNFNCSNNCPWTVLSFIFSSSGSTLSVSKF